MMGVQNTEKRYESLVYYDEGPLRIFFKAAKSSIFTSGSMFDHIFGMEKE